MMSEFISQFLSLPKVNQNKITVACVGDSITYGYGVSKYRSTQSYPAVLQSILGIRFQTLNYGLNGRTVLNEGDRPYRKEYFYKKSLAAKTDISILMLGTNDTKPYNWNGDRFEKELTELTESYIESASHKVLLMQPPKCFIDENLGMVMYDISNDLIRNDVYQMIKRVGESLGVSVIDLYHLTEQHQEWFMDGVHPNAIGNQNIARHIAGYIEDSFPEQKEKEGR